MSRVRPATRTPLLIIFASVAACSDPEAACSLDDSEWVGQEPECTDAERTDDPYGACNAPRISFRGCEYRRFVADQVFVGTYTDAEEPARFHFVEFDVESDGFLQDGGYSLVAPGGWYLRTTEMLVPWY